MLSSIFILPRRWLPASAGLAKWTHASGTLRVDYCYALSMGLLFELTQKFQLAQNASAWVLEGVRWNM